MYLHLNILKIPALFDIAFRHTIISQKYKRIVKNRFKVKPCIWRSTGGKKDKHLWFSQILTSWATGTAKVKSRKGETWTQRTPYLQWNMEVDCNPCSFILLLRLNPSQGRRRRGTSSSHLDEVQDPGQFPSPWKGHI